MRYDWNREALGRLGAIGIASVGLNRSSIAAVGTGLSEKLNIAVVGCGGQGGEI